MTLTWIQHDGTHRAEAPAGTITIKPKRKAIVERINGKATGHVIMATAYEIILGGKIHIGERDTLPEAKAYAEQWASVAKAA